MTEPVSLAQMRSHLRIDPDNTSEDDDIFDAITAARRACELYLNRSVIGGQRTKLFAGFPRYPYVLSGRIPERRQLSLTLDGGAVLSVDSVSYIDGAGNSETLAPDLYALDAAAIPALLTPLEAWPIAFDRPGSVSVTYSVSPLGLDDTQVVGRAIRLVVGNWYSNRESTAVNTRGTPDEIPHTVTWLLEPLRVRPFR